MRVNLEHSVPCCTLLIFIPFMILSNVTSSEDPRFRPRSEANDTGKVKKALSVACACKTIKIQFLYLVEYLVDFYFYSYEHAKRRTNYEEGINAR